MPEAPPAEPPLTPEEELILTEDVDLEPDLRRRVLVIHRRLDRLDHYALLGVDKSTDRKGIKRAYFDLAAKFHPDKYFRKRLGSYKLKMEAIFGRITQAHDTLTHREQREEYDRYLDEQRRSRGIEELMADALAEVSRAQEHVEREAAAAEEIPSVPPVSSRKGSSSPPRSVDPSSRRENLARRLLAGRAGSGAKSSAAPGARASAPSMSAVPPTPSTADAMEALRRRYKERKVQAQVSQARKYASNAEAALAAGDVVAAANAFRVATTLAPLDADLLRRAGEAQSRADAVLADTYTKQAGYEEKNNQWADAARSWARVCKGRPDDADAHEHAASAIVKASGDLHEASRLAQRACQLAPQSAHYRTSLANVYLAAGLNRNARRELETAAQLAPHDDTIQAMLRRVGKSA